MDSVVVVSYFPGIKPSDLFISDVGVLKDVLGDVRDVEVRACLWGLSDGVPVAVLAVDGAKDLCDNMRWWSEGDPVKWFRVVVGEHNGRYAVAIHPKVDLSVERMRLNVAVHRPDVVWDDSKVDVFFCPVVFTSETVGNFAKIKGYIGDQVKVGFIEVGDLERFGVVSGEVFEGFVHELGVCEVAGAEYGEWLEKVLG